MFRHNFLIYGSQIIAKNIAEVFYFPIWWYSIGLINIIKKEARFFVNQEKSLGFFIWVKNILVPMYGQSDWAGRIISFFVRFIQIIFRGLFLIFWLALLLALLFIWLAAPFFLFIALFFQISG